VAVKIRRRRHNHGGGEERRKHEQEMAARLAPLEETAAFAESDQRTGEHVAADTIKVSNATVKMPDKFLEEERDVSSVFRFEPLVLAILIAVLLFIAFVAWQITLMPAPSK
jgi:hypothetical protein